MKIVLSIYATGIGARKSHKPIEVPLREAPRMLNRRVIDRIQATRGACSVIDE